MIYKEGMDPGPGIRRVGQALPKFPKESSAILDVGPSHKNWRLGVFTQVRPSCGAPIPTPSFAGYLSVDLVVSPPWGWGTTEWGADFFFLSP